MAKCCQVKTSWEVKETRWTIIEYGIDNGGILCPPKGSPAGNYGDPDYEGGNPKNIWVFIGAGLNPIFRGEDVDTSNELIVRELFTPPYNSEGYSCINTSGGTLVDEYLVDSNDTHEGFTLKKRVNNSASSYWLNTVTGRRYYGGYEEFKRRVRLIEEIYILEYEATHTAGPDTCCQPNSKTQRIFTNWQGYYTRLRVQTSGGPGCYGFTY